MISHHHPCDMIKAELIFMSILPSGRSPASKQKHETCENNGKFSRKNLFEFSASSSSRQGISTKSNNHIMQTPASNTTPSQDSPFIDKRELSNLLSFEAGARVLFATDEWFAIAENLLKDGPPIFIPNLYCREGKVMDGWETRRKRVAGHDWCILKLAGNNGGHIYGMEIDTAHFTGNQAPRVSIHAMNYKERHDMDENNHPISNTNDVLDVLSAYTWMPGSLTRLARGRGPQGIGVSAEIVAQAEEACKAFTWTEVLPMTFLRPGYEETRMHYFIIPESQRRNVTHVRLNIFPDGGIARLRVWGYPIEEDIQTPMETIYEPPSSQPYHHPEVSLCTNGGLGLHCSNRHYGVPQNLIQPSYGKDMGDGWETARHPFRPAVIVKDPTTNLVDSPLMDWAILKLGMGGIFGGEKGGISRIIIDTKHFRGNYPESVRLEGCYFDEKDSRGEDSEYFESLPWFELIPRTRLGPDQEHVFDRERTQILNDRKDVSHIRVSIFPDGGLSRIRVYGTPRCPNN